MVLGRASIVAVLIALTFSLATLVGLTRSVGAAETEKINSRVPMPVIPMGQGDSCVEDTEFMRRNHMELLLHQRDETMFNGIRSKQHSLRECVACHAVPGPDNLPVTVASPEHFCRSCHDYAAVKIDCFECHASRPDPETAGDDHGVPMAGAERE